MALIQHQIVGSEVSRRTRLPTGYAAVQLSPVRRGRLAGALLLLALLLLVAGGLTLAVLARTGLLAR